MKKRLKKGAIPVDSTSNTCHIATENADRLGLAFSDSPYSRSSPFWRRQSTTLRCALNSSWGDDQNINYFTGFRSYKVFQMVFELFEVGSSELSGYHRSYFFLVLVSTGRTLYSIQHSFVNNHVVLEVP